MERNGREILEISAIEFEGAERGRIQSENIPSTEAFSEESISEHATVFQMSTGNVRQYLSKLNEKKNKYKQMALRARNDLRQLTELTMEKFAKIDVMENAVEKLQRSFQDLKARYNFLFITLVVFMFVAIILIVSIYTQLLDAT